MAYYLLSFDEIAGVTPCMLQDRCAKATYVGKTGTVQNRVGCGAHLLHLSAGVQVLQQRRRGLVSCGGWHLHVNVIRIWMRRVIA